MRKGLKSKAEFIFLDAPFLAAPEGPEPDAAAAEEAAPAGRSWWQWRDLEPTRPSRAAQYTGWQASQDAIDAALRENAPVDVLLGFSQGATAVALFLAHQAPAPAPDSAAAASLRLAVVIGGFMPRDEEFAGAIAAARPLLPSLHVSGASDAVVPEERGRALFEAFEAAAWHQHPGGHMVSSLLKCLPSWETLRHWWCQHGTSQNVALLCAGAYVQRGVQGGAGRGVCSGSGSQAPLTPLTLQAVVIQHVIQAGIRRIRRKQIESKPEKSTRNNNQIHSGRRELEDQARPQCWKACPPPPSQRVGSSARCWLGEEAGS